MQPGDTRSNSLKFLRNRLPICALAFVVGALVSGCAYAAAPTPDQSNLLSAAKREIQDSNESRNRETACSIYVKDVLNRAGYAVPAFMANEFNDIVAKFLPNWSEVAFNSHDSSNDQDDLKKFLNAQPDHSVLLAQWPRINRSGHVALIEKVADDSYVIYQAQQGKATPHSKPTTLASLLYSANQYGDRSKLRLFVER